MTSLKAGALYQRVVNYLKRKYPAIMTIGRLAKWCLATLKKTFFGLGVIFLFIIIALYVAGVLIEPARWYLVGIASAMLLLGGGLLALSYARFVINRIIRDQRTQVRDVKSDLKKDVSDIKKALRTSEAELRKEIKTIERELSVIKDDVFIIGYDILKEQNKLAEKVSQLESQASNDKRAKRPPNDNIE